MFGSPLCARYKAALIYLQEDKAEPVLGLLLRHRDDPLVVFGLMHAVFAEMPLAISSISVVSNTNLLNLAPSVHLS